MKNQEKSSLPEATNPQATKLVDETRDTIFQKELDEDREFEKLCDDFDQPGRKIVWDSKSMKKTGNDVNVNIVDIDEIFPEAASYRTTEKNNINPVA